MITLKEAGSIILAIVILAFANSFTNFDMFLKSLIFFAIILIIYIASKKAAAFYLDCREETKIWMFQRFGFSEKNYLKSAFPIGIILPFILTVLSLGWIKWFAVLQSDISGTSTRAVRKHDFYSYSELTEWHLALISAAGVVSMFIVALISYLLNYPELSRLCIYYLAFNMIPIGKLDGTKVFFGSRALFTILWVLTALGLVYAFLLP